MRSASRDQVRVDEFVAWVNRYVTPPMAALGFEVCSTGEGKGTVGPVALKRLSRWGASRIRRGLPPLLRTRRKWQSLFSVGFEGDRGHELWVSYAPDDQTLDVSQWDYTLARHDDWNGRAYVEPVERADLEQRLRILGQAITL